MACLEEHECLIFYYVIPLNENPQEIIQKIYENCLLLNIKKFTLPYKFYNHVIPYDKWYSFSYQTILENILFYGNQFKEQMETKDIYQLIQKHFTVHFWINLLKEMKRDQDVIVFVQLLGTEH
jgi:hypothetical protein